MRDHFDLKYAPEHRLLKLKLAGIWSPSVLNAFVLEAVALRRGVEQAGHRDDRGRMLLDLTSFPVQPKEIAKSLSELLPRFGDRTGKVAVIRSPSALQHMQMQRLLKADKTRIFLSIAEGEAWLAEDTSATGDPAPLFIRTLNTHGSKDVTRDSDWSN